MSDAGVWRSLSFGAGAGVTGLGDIVRDLTTPYSFESLPGIDAASVAFRGSIPGLDTGSLAVSHLGSAMLALGNTDSWWDSLFPASGALQSTLDSIAQGRFGMPRAFSSAWLDGPTHALAWLGERFDLWSLLSRDLQAIADDQQAWRASLPPNLRRINYADLGKLEQIVDEGIPVWGVPSSTAVDNLLAAQTTQQRRDILGRTRADILATCRDSAAALQESVLAPQTRFLNEAADALDAGYLGASQSLSANVLDSLLWMNHDSERRKRLTGHGSRRGDLPLDHFRELSLSHALALRPVWFAYRPQHGTSHRAVSRSFGRHWTAHNIDARQINGRNATQALALATSLALFLESEP